VGKLEAGGMERELNINSKPLDLETADKGHRAALPQFYAS
jgi:hypothetical protein